MDIAFVAKGSLAVQPTHNVLAGRPCDKSAFLITYVDTFNILSSF